MAAVYWSRRTKGGISSLRLAGGNPAWGIQLPLWQLLPREGKWAVWMTARASRAQGKDEALAMRLGIFPGIEREVRAGEVRELKANDEEPVLTRSRWLLLKRPENLSESQQARLAELLQYNLKSVRAYLLKEEFQLFWGYISPYWAGRFLERWCTKTMRSRIEPMKRVARMLRRHEALVLNWFRAKGQLSSGVVEGFNTKAKLTSRKSFGFRTYRAAEIALYHALGALPEPTSTHRFS
ncbi:MAG: transposase, partial [Nitrococcus sp.]|nr:transposase [Nitrococcus sp.]